MSDALPPNLEAIIRIRILKTKRQALRERLREGIAGGAPQETDIDALVDALNVKLDRR